MASLLGRVAVVTGAARGLGKAIAIGLARAGCDVALCSRSPRDLETVAERTLRDSGRRVYWQGVNVASAAEVATFSDAACTALGPVSILINNAAGWVDADFLEVSPEDIEATIDVTLKGPIWMARSFWRQLKQTVPGHIVNITNLGLGHRAAMPHQLM